jgi:predicted transcriptional regulator
MTRKKSITIQLDPEVVKALQVIADANAASLAWATRRIVALGLKHYQTEKGEK